MTVQYINIFLLNRWEECNVNNEETYEQKRVVHITTVHPPFDTRIFYKECASLAKANHEVYLIHTQSNDFDLNKFEEYDIKPIVLPKHKGRVRRVLKGTKDALNEALKLKADIYHLHDPELLLISDELIKTGATVVYDMHEDNYTSLLQKTYIFKPLRYLMANFLRMYENNKTGRLEIVIAEKYYQNSFPMSVKILNYPILNDKTKDISYTNNKRLLYTGNVNEQRGALIHAKIPSYMSDVEVKFVGRCRSGLVDQMKELSGGERRIEIRGIDEFISREEIDREYNDKKWLAGIAIFPPTDHYMKKELTKFFEYMYAGLPMIVSDFPEWKTFIEKHQCGITVPYNDEKAIKNAINYLIDNPESARKMGENGQKAVIEELNWSNEAEKLLKLYDSFG